MAAFNPLALLAERACSPIYNAIDTGNVNLAIRHADKILASQPSIGLASALKTIALIRSGRKEEASKICDELLKRDLFKSGDGVTIIHPLSWSLSRLERSQDEVELLERACKAQPYNEDLARQAFSAMIKSRQYQKAQQAALRMHKNFGSRQKTAKLREQYFWWCIQSYLLLSRNTKEPGATLALPLSERMIQKQLESSPLTNKNEEELSLYLKVLIRLGKKDEAFKLLSKPDSVGAELSDRSLGVDFLRRELAEDLQNWTFVRDEAKAKIEAGGRNWGHILAFISSSVKLGDEALQEADKLLSSIATSSEGSIDRSGRLAQLELLRARQAATSTPDSSQIAADLISRYFDSFATKACCHEDLLPYLPVLEPEERSKLSDKLDGKRKKSPVKTEKDLRFNINIAKIQRSLFSKEQVTLEKEVDLATQRMQEYLDGLEIGKDLPDSEMQPADDLALLSAQSLVSAFSLSGQDVAFLHQAVTLLELGCSKSKKGYQLRMLLIRCYLLLGCFDRAAIHYNLIGIKAIQNDTLSHFFSDRVSTFVSLANTVPKMIAAAEEIYEENRRATPDMIVKAFEHGTYSRIEEFVEFGESVDRSVQRQVLRAESGRIKLLSSQKEAQVLAEQIGSDVTLGVHDQRDFTILSNLQPLDSPTIDELGALGPRPNLGWIRSMQYLLSPTAAIPSDQDQLELTPQERSTLDLVIKLRADALSEQDVHAFFKGTKQQISSCKRPFDILHTASTTLQVLRSCQVYKEIVKANLAEMATLINHHSRSLSESIEWSALRTGLSKLGSAQVEALRRSTLENTSNSLRKALDTHRDALRNV